MDGRLTREEHRPSDDGSAVAIVIFIGMSLGSEPLFYRDVKHYIIGDALKEEVMAEKFQAIQRGEELLLFYESRPRQTQAVNGERPGPT